MDSDMWDLYDKAYSDYSDKPRKPDTNPYRLLQALNRNQDMYDLYDKAYGDYSDKPFSELP